jgi:hypothetical protein
VASAAEHEGDDNNGTPRYVWTSCGNANHPTAGDKITVAGVAAEVAADKFFHGAKFVDCDTGLMYDEKERGHICKFITTSCNLEADIDIST